MKNQEHEEIYIYVLLLENEMIYVGQSIDIEGRFKDHYGKNGRSNWAMVRYYYFWF